MAAHERIKKNVEVGLTMKEKLQKAKKITTGILTASGKHRLNRDVHSEIKDRKRRRIEKEVDTKRKSAEERNLIGTFVGERICPA